MKNLKFISFLMLILNSNRGSFALEGDESIEETDYSDVESIFEGLDTEDAGSSESDDATEGMADENGDSDEQPEGDSEELSLEEKLAKFELEKAEGETDVLGSINQLGILRKGLPVEIESEEQLKELISKGVDYTQKTQELADLRKEYEQELETREAQLSERETAIQTAENATTEDGVQNQVFGQILETLKSHDPEIFEWIQSQYQNGMSQYKMYSDNPVVNGLKSEIEQLKGLAETMQATKQDEDYSEIQKDWESGVSEVSTEMGAKLRGLGIKTDWNAVAKHWSQGDMTVKQAVFSVYGEKIQQAMDAKNKLTKTKLASQQRRGPSKVDQSIKDETKSGGEESNFDWLMKHMKS